MNALQTRNLFLSRTYCAIAFLLAGAIYLNSSVIWSAHAQDPPITPSGLNTQVSDPIAVGGQTQYDIIGGTRPESGANLFHSFGDFNVPANNIANFLNDTGLPTSNILARVTGSNGNNPTFSSIYGTIQTTGFENASLFLLNPAGFLFGPNATLNVGGLVAFTSADYLKLTDSTRFNAIPHTAADALLTALPVASFGFLGPNLRAITVQGSQFTVTDGQSISLVGGNVMIQSGTPEGGTAQPARLSAPNGNILLASAASPGEFDSATLQPLPNVNGTSFRSFGSVMLTTGSTIDISGESTVSIRNGQFVLAVNDAVLTTAMDADPSDTITLSRGSSIVTSNSWPDPGADIQLVAGQLTMDGAAVRSSTVGEGRGGNISVSAQSIALVSGAQIASTTKGRGSSGAVSVAATSSLTISGFDTTSTLTGIASDLPVIASGVFTNTTTEGVGGELTIAAPRLIVEDTGRIATFTSGDGMGGNVSVNSGEIDLRAGGRIFTGSGLDFVTFETRGNGKAGNIAVIADSLSISGVDSFGVNSAIRSKPESTGDGGSITVTTKSIAIDDQGMIETIPFGDGRAGNIALTTDTLTITGGGAVQTSGSDVAPSGNIIITATDTISVRGIGADGTPSRITNENFGNGGTGNIAIQAKELIVADGAWIRNTTFFDPTPSLEPKISLHATDSINLTGGADIRVSGFLSDVGSIEISAQTISMADRATVSTFTFDNGNAGNISIAANNLELSGGSQMTSSTWVGTGYGGNVLVTVTNDLTLSGQFTDDSGIVTPTAILSNSQFGSSGRGGNITIVAGRSVELNSGASISASSTGSGNAGNISINAGQQFEMHDSSVKTSSEQAGGGNIAINASEQISIVNGLISASAFRDGGNITIDPILMSLQNSQILAQAIQGAGGNITITASLFLADSSSLVSASSQFGLNGTVTIQSPTSNLSGSLGPLTSKPSQAQSLLTQRCAALANGQASSFVVAGREQLQADPGSWLSGPIALAGIDVERFGEGTVAEGTSNLEPRTSNLLASDRVSLRRLTPARFLMANFADSEATGCHS